MDQQRQPAGVPTGGQFASKSHSESTGVSLASDLPEPSDIDDALYQEVGKILEGIDGVTTENVIDLMAHDEDQIVAAFGQGPTDWLCGLKVVVEGSSRQTYPGSLTEPDEWTSGGYVTVEDPDGNQVAAADWNGEDDPELPRLMRRCPVDASGRPLADPADPGWERLGSTTGLGRSSEWRRCGFHTPDEAIAWRGAGFSPEGASAWADEGFGPDEAKEFRLGGLSVSAAMAHRRRSAADPASAADGQVVANSPVVAA